MTAQTTTQHPHHPEGYCTLATCDYDRARLGLSPAKASLTVQEPTPRGHYLSGNMKGWDDALAEVRTTALNTVGDHDAHNVYAHRMVALAKRVARAGEAAESFASQAAMSMDDDMREDMRVRCLHQEQTYAYALMVALGQNTDTICPADMIALAAYLVALVG